MAKCKGPLLSQSASGSVGGILTFSKRKAFQQVRYQKKQKDNITEARTAQRLKFSLAVSWWNILNSSEKLEWLNLGNSF